MRSSWSFQSLSSLGQPLCAAGAAHKRTDRPDVRPSAQPASARSQRGQGEGWQTGASAPAVGVHARGPGPGDRVSLPYFTVADVAAALERVVELGGDVVHPGEQWAICRDSEGSPFGLARG